MEDLDIEKLLNRVSGNDPDARAELKRMLKKTEKNSGISATVNTQPGVRATGQPYPLELNGTVNAGVIPPEIYRKGGSNVHQLATNVESCVGTMNDFLATTRKIREPMNQLNSAWERLAHVSAVQSEAWTMLGEKLQKRNSTAQQKEAGYRKTATINRSPIEKTSVSARVQDSSRLPKDTPVREPAGPGNLR